MQVRCKNLTCKKISAVSEDWVACPYCGNKFSNYGINVKELVAEENAANMYRHGLALLASLVWPGGLLACLFYIYQYRMDWLKNNIWIMNVMIGGAFMSFFWFLLVDLLRHASAKKKFPRTFNQPDF